MDQKMYAKMVNMITRTVLDNVVVNDDGTLTCKHTMLDGDTNNDDEIFQHYGFASVPLSGAEGIVLSIEGNNDHGIIISTEDGRYHLKDMKNGEVALYTDEGDRVYLKRGNEIEVVTKKLTATVSGSAKIDCPNVEATGNMEIGGNLTVTGDISGAQVSDSVGSLADLRTDHQTHTHNVVCAAPGVTVTTTPPAPAAV